MKKYPATAYHTTDKGYRFVWVSRRSCYEVDIYAIEEDGAPAGEPLAELEYPKLFGSSLPVAHMSFAREALSFVDKLGE